MTFEEMKIEVIEELKAELSEDGESLDETALKLLESKVKGAIREVKAARRYPTTYTAEMIDTDMDNYYGQVKNLALYDFNHIGIEFQVGSAENGISRTFQNRETVFNGVLPIGRMLR